MFKLVHYTAFAAASDSCVDEDDHKIYKESDANADKEGDYENHKVCNVWSIFVINPYIPIIVAFIYDLS